MCQERNIKVRNRVFNILKDTIKKLFNEEISPEVTHPPSPKLGDYSTNAAFILTDSLKNPPEDIASKLAKNIKDDSVQWAKSIDGFVNIKIKKEAWIEELKESLIVDYGDSDFGKDQKILLEFVSANPTGPLHVASARAATFGDSLNRILKSQGFDVYNEYYFNDSGTQVELLGKSIGLKIKELNGEKVNYPENAYLGNYITKLAKKAKDEKIKNFTEFGVNEILKIQKSTLKRFRVYFDEWISETELKDKGMADKVIRDLGNLKHSPLLKKEGALWFMEGERERVFIRSNGSYTYIVPDIAYHRFKFDRGYKILIDLLGPDHIDHIPELKASLELLNYPAENLEVKIIQWVTLKRGKETIKMSKRSGEFITIDELIDEVGVDAARFFFLLRKSSIPMDFDLELAKEQSERNPVYYIQYGHARISSLLDYAKYKGYSVNLPDNLELLTNEEELKLIRKIPEFKEALEDSAKMREPHLLAYYLLDLSKLYHNFYQSCRIVGGEEELVIPRLFLSSAIKNIVSRGLSLLGVSAPLRM
jgi:arginyl-tRNA synthetase